MPVDYRLVENPDGSKTVWVGELEWRHRMRWIVGLTLYPDKSYIEATINFSIAPPSAIPCCISPMWQCMPIRITR